MTKGKIIAIGNAIIDIIIKSDDQILKDHNLVKGSMTLINDDMSTKLSHSNIAKIDCGGSAANTIHCLSLLASDIDCEFIGKVADDDFGHEFFRKIHARNIKFYTHMDDRSKTATSFVIVTNDGQRTMCTNLGCASNINEDDIIEDNFINANILYLEGYLWDKPSTILALKKAINIAKKYRVKIALSASDSLCVKRHKNDFLKLIEDDIDILFCNEDEFLSLMDVQYYDKNEAFFFLKKYPKLITLITRAEKGCVIINNDFYELCNANPVTKIIDSTGAGDVFAAGFLYKFIQGNKLIDCASYGNFLAEKIIQKYGARFNLSEI